MKTKTKVALTLGLLSLLALGGLTQSRYVRDAAVKMDITNEADVAMREGVNPDVKNTSSGWISYPVEKTGYYAIQLKGGDGGTNNAGTGGKGGVVEEVYYLEKGQTVYYSLGGRGGFYANGSDNRTAGGSEYNAGGTGGNSGIATGDASSRQGGGGGGASIIRLGSSSGTDIMIAGGGGGGKTSGIGGAKGTSSGNYGSGSGSSSWLAGSLNGKNALNLTDYWKDIIGRPAGFALTTGQGGSQQQGGQIRIAFLWTDAEAGHKGIDIYK